MQSEERSPAARKKIPKLPEMGVKYLRRSMNQEKVYVGTGSRRSWRKIT
jgi:hypothetical protein